MRQGAVVLGLAGALACAEGFAPSARVGLAIVVAPAAPSAPLSKRVSYQLTSTNEPLWRTDGVLFQVGGILYGQLYFRRNDGTVFRLTRTARDLHFPGIKK